MVKKIILLIIILCLAAGGFFYWQQNQTDVRELNKTLPEGVRVVKSLFGDEYKVVNKIDNYEFKIPSKWEGIKEIEYIPERTEEKYIAASIGLEGNEGSGRIVAVDRFRLTIPASSLEEWAETNFETFGLVADFSKDMVGELEIIRTQEFIMPIGYVYFFKKDFAVYAVTCGSEEFIRYIITHGKW